MATSDVDIPDPNLRDYIVKLLGLPTDAPITTDAMKRLGGIASERIEERMDKRFVEVNQRIDGLRSDVNQRLSDMNAEMSKMNQNHIDHLNRHHS